MSPTHSIDIEPPATRSELELQLEREKIEIERERLALERDRLEAEREKWRADAIWKQRAEGRFGLPATTWLLAALLCLLAGGIVGTLLAPRGPYRTDVLDRSEMALRIAQAMQTSTNIADQVQGRFLLRALSDAPPASSGGYLVILE